MPTDDSNPWDEPEEPAADPTAEAPAPSLAKPAAADDAGEGDAPAGATAASDDGPSSDAADGEVATPDADDGEPSAEDRRRILIIAVVAFALIAGVAFFLTQGDDDDTTATDGTTTTVAGGQPGGSGSEPGAGGSVTISGTADSFNREDSEDGLGTLPSGAEWVVQSGTWGIQSGEVAVLQPEADKRNTVYVGTGYPDPQAQVRLTTIANGAGLVFRYQGECNYWAVYAVPEYATWNVEKVVDCERVGGGGPDSQVFRTIPQAPVGDGTTVGVVVRGEQVQIVLNGRVASTFDDPHLAGVGKVGLTARGPASGDARFDDFVAGGPGGEGVVGGGEGEGSAPAGGEGEEPADGGGEPDSGSGG